MSFSTFPTKRACLSFASYIKEWIFGDIFDARKPVESPNWRPVGLGGRRLRTVGEDSR